VVERNVRPELLRLPPERQGVGEAVARERQHAEPGDRLRAPWIELERTPERLLGARIVGRIAGLAGTLLVREAEQGESAGAVRLLAKRALERVDQADGVAGGEAGLEPLARQVGNRGAGLRRSGVLAEDSAEEKGGGGDRRHHPCR
jgi:hypothetical protein